MSSGDKVNELAKKLKVYSKDETKSLPSPKIITQTDEKRLKNLMKKFVRT